MFKFEIDKELECSKQNKIKVMQKDFRKMKYIKNWVGKVQYATVSARPNSAFSECPRRSLFLQGD